MVGVVAEIVIASFAPAILQNIDLLKKPTARGSMPGAGSSAVVPLTFAGFGVSTFIYTADVVPAQNFLGTAGGAADYIFGGTLCRAIVLFTVPLAAVMFPKLVHSAARSQKSNVMGTHVAGHVRPRR